METQKTSSFLRLDFSDLAKGVAVAVLSSVIPVITETVNAGSLMFDWALILKVASASAFGYLSKNLFTNSKEVVKR